MEDLKFTRRRRRNTRGVAQKDQRDITVDKRTAEAVKIVKRYVKELRKNGIKVTRAYLYGSYAYGKPHRDSDIEVTVTCPLFRFPPKSSRAASMSSSTPEETYPPTWRLW